MGTPDGGGPHEGGWDVLVSRQQFDWWIRPVVHATVDALDSITRRNAVPPDAPVYLSGGSCRTGLVRTLFGTRRYRLFGAGNNGDVPELTVVQSAVLMGGCAASSETDRPDSAHGRCTPAGGGIG